MITIRRSFDKWSGSYDLKITGHADSGPKGKDIVCAAVSILAYTVLDEVMSAAGTSAEIKKADVDPGAFHLAAFLTSGEIGRVESIERGFVLLRKKYPEFVTFK